MPFVRPALVILIDAISVQVLLLVLKLLIFKAFHTLQKLGLM